MNFCPDNYSLDVLKNVWCIMIQVLLQLHLLNHHSKIDHHAKNSNISFLSNSRERSEQTGLDVKIHFCLKNSPTKKVSRKLENCLIILHFLPSFQNDERGQVKNHSIILSSGLPLNFMSEERWWFFSSISFEENGRKRLPI